MAIVKIRKNDLLWVYVSRFLTIGINILLLPLLMKYLTGDELGLWYVFSSIAQVVNLFDFGFNSTISRHMTYAWSGACQLEKTSVSENFDDNINENLVSEIIITCRLVYLIISAVALAVMATAGSVYVSMVVRNGMTGTITISWIVYMLSVFLNMFYGYWSSLLQGIGAVAERNKMGVLAKSIQMVFAVVLILMGYGLLGFVISYFVSGIILRAAGKRYFARKMGTVEINHKVKANRIQKCFSAVWGTAWKDGVVMLAQYLSTQANTLICAYYIDLSATSVYGLMTQIVSVIASVASSYYSAYQPAFSSACLRRDTEEQKRIVCETDFIYKALFVLGVFALFLAGFPLIHIVRPGIQIGIPFSILLCVFYYFFNQKDLFASMIASANEVPFWSAYVISAVCSLMLSILLVRVFQMGIMGLVMAQLLINTVYNCWRWPIYVLKRLDIGYSEIYTIGYGSVKSRVLATIDIIKKIYKEV